MRKLATLLIAAGLVFGAATGASAIDFKAKGEWMFSFDYGQGSGFTKKNLKGKTKNGWGNSQDEFNAKQRVRLQLDAIANENLMGEVFFEIGNNTWGDNDESGALGADGKCVEVRRAFIDWMIPDTDLKVRMGLQGMALPSFTMGKSQVFQDDVAGITVSYKFTENVGITAFWARPYNDNYTSSDTYKDNSNFMDNVDAFGLTIPLTFDGLKVTPWGMIAAIGPNALRGDLEDEDGNYYSSAFGNYSNLGTSKKQMVMGLLPAWGLAGSKTADTAKIDDYATAWWAGVTADCTMFDPFRIAIDVMGGSVSWDESRLDRAGWMAAALVEYKMDWGIPGIIGWYASGDDDDLGNGSERMPFLTIGNGDNTFSNFALDGNNMISREGIVGSSMAGTWGVGVRVRDMSFIENLKHTFRFNIIGGTNDSSILKKVRALDSSAGYMNSGTYGVDALYLTDEDTAYEIGLRTDYKMYENFDISLDANYITLDLGSDSKLYGQDYTDCWNINVGFTYSF